MKGSCFLLATVEVNKSYNMGSRGGAQDHELEGATRTVFSHPASGKYDRAIHHGPSFVASFFVSFCRFLASATRIRNCRSTSDVGQERAHNYVLLRATDGRCIFKGLGKCHPHGEAFKEGSTNTKDRKGGYPRLCWMQCRVASRSLLFQTQSRLAQVCVMSSFFSLPSSRQQVAQTHTQNTRHTGRRLPRPALPANQRQLFNCSSLPLLARLTLGGQLQYVEKARQ